MEWSLRNCVDDSIDRKMESVYSKQFNGTIQQAEPRELTLKLNKKKKIIYWYRRKKERKKEREKEREREKKMIWNWNRNPNEL